MKKKNPAIAAVLNFFLPGLGFVYLGSPIFIVTGIGLFLCIVISLAGAPSVQTPTGVVAAEVGAAFVFAAISWEVTNLFNAARESQQGTPGGG